MITIKPTLSIIVPCYNCADFLDDCVKSLVNQKQCCDYEIILVNDGSTDDGKTLQKCRDLVKKFSNIENWESREINDENCQSKLKISAKNHHYNLCLVNLETNMGLSGARNSGMKKCCGKYITFVDADDTVTPHYLELIVKKIQDNPESDIFIGGCNEIHIDQNHEIIKTVELIPDSNTSSNNSEIMSTAIALEKQTLFGYAWNKVYLRSLIESNILNFKNVRLIEDVLFNIDAFGLASQITTISAALIDYKRDTQSSKKTDSASLTHVFLEDYFDCFYQKIETMYKWFETKNCLTDEVKSTLANEYVRYAFSAIWRNKDSRSGLNKKAQKQWVFNFYNLEMTNKLLKYANPKGRLASIMASALKSKKINRVMLIAELIHFVHNNMSWLLVYLRQSR